MNMVKVLLTPRGMPGDVYIVQAQTISGDILAARSPCHTATINWDPKGWECSVCDKRTTHDMGVMGPVSSIMKLDSDDVMNWLAQWTGYPEENIMLEVVR